MGNCCGDRDKIGYNSNLAKAGKMTEEEIQTTADKIAETCMTKYDKDKSGSLEKNEQGELITFLATVGQNILRKEIDELKKGPNGD